jgi:hypothetical protein
MPALLKSIAASVRAALDTRDVMLGIGLGLLALGLWQIYPPAAAIAPGAVLVGVAIFGVKGPGEGEGAE